MTDRELVEAVDREVDAMYKNRKIPPRHIPARPDEDFDLLVGELVLRFLELIEAEDGI
ncbi:MAG: hypothetical protein GY938_16825 [Ketobacter sp.]|nr:hypothetical protein [Ketobacter sp.]